MYYTVASTGRPEYARKEHQLGGMPYECLPWDCSPGSPAYGLGAHFPPISLFSCSAVPSPAGRLAASELFWSATIDIMLAPQWHGSQITEGLLENGKTTQSVVEVCSLICWALPAKKSVRRDIITPANEWVGALLNFDL